MVREYSKGLTPALSPLRPPVGAGDRLRMWIPAILAQSNSSYLTTLASVSEAEKLAVKSAMLASLEESTRQVYGSGLLVYHVFCDQRDTPEADRAPASADLIKVFIASISGSYAGTTIDNYVYGVRAWHKCHGLAWNISDSDLDTLLRSAKKQAPTSSKRKQRVPVTPAYLTVIKSHMDLSDPRQAAVWACMTTTFYAAARLGEFTVTNLTAFKPTKHVKPSDVRLEIDRNGNEIIVFRLPHTKTKTEGEDVFWARQEGPTDPEAAWENHKAVNAPPEQGHLFAYRHEGSHRPLTKPEFFKVLKKAAAKAELEAFQGHSLRIGATLEYLLRGLSFEAMKAKGRWSSDAFSVYLTQHAQILAPYIQAHPRLHESFLRQAAQPSSDMSTMPNESTY